MMDWLTMETKKSRDLPYASWRPRKAAGVVWFKPKCLRPRGANGLSPSLSLKGQELDGLMV